MNKPLHLLFRIPPTLSHRTIPRLTAKYRPLQAVQARTMTSYPQKQQHPPTQPRFSQGSEAAASEKTLSALLASDGSGGRWTLTADGEGVERMFRFKTFAKTWDFMTAVSLQCKLKNHHPEWSNVFNTTFIRWTTHNPKGLSSKDLDLAATCDALARDFGEVVEESTKDQDASASSQLCSLTNKAVTGSGDCCK